MDRVVETVVALSGLYLFLSLISLAVVEGISNLFSLRARHLRRGLGALLERDAAEVLSHPLVASLGRASGRRSGLPSYIPRDIFTSAVLDALRPAPDAPRDTGSALRILIEQSAGDRSALRARIDAWFDAGMERLSGTYKRSVQRITRVAALLLVIGLNADSVEIGQQLWGAPTLREGAALYSRQLLERCTPDETGRLVCPRTDGAGQAPPPYPLGWSAAKVEALAHPGDLGQKLLGLLLTVLAATLGAPFWFDVLRRLAPGLRQSGPRPEEDALPTAVARPGATPAADPPSGGRVELVAVELTAPQRSAP